MFPVKIGRCYQEAVRACELKYIRERFIIKYSTRLLMDDYRAILAILLSATLAVLKFVNDWMKFTAWTVIAAFGLVLIYSYPAPVYVPSEHASLTPKPGRHIVEAEGHANGSSQAVGHGAAIIAVVGAA